MPKTLLPLLFPLMVTFTSNMTQPVISGTVYDKQTHETLCGVSVITDKDTTYTDFDGHFKLKNSSDITKIRFEMISYERYSTTIDAVTFSLKSKSKETASKSND